MCNVDEKFGEKGFVGLGLLGFVNCEIGVGEIINICVVDGKIILKDLSECLGCEVRGENDVNCFVFFEVWDENNK